MNILFADIVTTEFLEIPLMKMNTFNFIIRKVSIHLILLEIVRKSFFHWFFEDFMKISPKQVPNAISQLLEGATQKKNT